MTKDRVKLLIEDFGEAEIGRLEGEEFDLNQDEMIRDPNKDLDVYFMEHIGIFASYKYGSLYKRRGNTWVDQFRDVAAGEYPLEQIPDHVRDLAKQLYYDKE